MRDIIRKQLEECVFADISNYDPETNTFLIKKYNRPDYKVGSCYLIKLKDNVLYDKDSVLAINWNKGNLPIHNYIKIYVSQTMGKMIHVDGLYHNFETGEDYKEMWSGWLNIDDIILISKNL